MLKRNRSNCSAMTAFKFIFIFIFLVITGCAKNGGDVPKDQLPIEHLPDQAQVLGYNLELYLQERKDEFTGHLEIDLVLNQPTSRLWIHGAQLRMGVIQIIGSTISNGEWYQHTPEGLASIVFDKEIPAGHSKLILDYSAPYSSGLKGLIRSKDKSEYIASMAEAGARYILPGFDEPKFRAPLTLSINLPNSLSALASTANIENTALENERHILQFASSEPVTLGDYSFAIGRFAEPALASTQASTVRFYNLDRQAIVVDALAAIEHDSGQPYPYNGLNIVAMNSITERVYAAGLMVNPSLQKEAMGQQLAAQWVVLPAGFRNWSTRCVATGMARWLGLQAMHKANLVDTSFMQTQWRKAKDLSEYSLGEVCWDMPSDLVFAAENNEDQQLVAGALFQLSLKHSDLANRLWQDTLDHRGEQRLLQDLPSVVYQRIYPLLQSGQLMPHKCESACLYPWAAQHTALDTRQALADPALVSVADWHRLLADDAVRAYLWDVFERSKGFPPASAQRVYGDAWQVAFGLAMQKDFDNWSSYLRRVAAEAEASDVRMTALYALTESTDERVVAWLQQMLLNQMLIPVEADALFARMLASPQAHAQFTWFSNNRDKLMRKMTPAQRARWIDALGGLCSASYVQEIMDTIQPVAKFIYRGEARLERAIARVNACIAK